MKKEINFGQLNGQPLVWVPLFTTDAGQSFITKNNVCSMTFADKNEGYQDSNVRKYILEEFVPNVFQNNELSLLVPNKYCKNDLVWTVSQHELKTCKWIGNSVFKEKHRWWLSAHVEGNYSDVISMGAVGFMGIMGDIPKNRIAGVRPCVTFPPNVNPYAL